MKKTKTNEEIIANITKLKEDYNREIDRLLFEYNKKVQDIVDHSHLRKLRDNI